MYSSLRSTLYLLQYFSDTTLNVCNEKEKLQSVIIIGIFSKDSHTVNLLHILIEHSHILTCLILKRYMSSIEVKSNNVFIKYIHIWSYDYVFEDGMAAHVLLNDELWYTSKLLFYDCLFMYNFRWFVSMPTCCYVAIVPNLSTMLNHNGSNWNNCTLPHLIICVVL